MTKEEALNEVAKMPPERRATFDRYWNAYRELRQKLGPDVHISRQAVAEAARTKSISMAVQAMKLIEPLESDRKRYERPTEPRTWCGRPTHRA
ncbi:hypothetical protein AB7M17_006006 [Bradyrhizobium sp. USDA 377]